MMLRRRMMMTNMYTITMHVNNKAADVGNPGVALYWIGERPELSASMLTIPEDATIQVPYGTKIGLACAESFVPDAWTRIIINGVITTATSDAEPKIITDEFIVTSPCTIDVLIDEDVGSDNYFATINVSFADLSDLPLGTLVRIANNDDGVDEALYEVADKNNFISDGVVLVRKNIHSTWAFKDSTAYPNGTLDNKMTSIYNSLPVGVQIEILDATFDLEGSGSITRKVFALTRTMVGFGENHGAAEGKALQLYNSDTNRIKTNNGTANEWWLSSRNNSDNSFLYYVTIDGGITTSYYDACNSFGVVPAFVLPKTVGRSTVPDANGIYNLLYPKTYMSLSDLPLGALVRIVGGDGGVDEAIYEIADKNNFKTNAAVLVRKTIHSKSYFSGGDSAVYPDNDLDNKMTSIYNSLPVGVRSEVLDATFDLKGSGGITRKVFALTYTMAGFGTNNGTTEGKALQHYNSNANRIKTYNGAADRWWLSSSNTNVTNVTNARFINSNGDTRVVIPSYFYGVVPAFVLSLSVQVEADADVNGVYNLAL